MLKTDEHRRAPTGHVHPPHLTPLLSFQGLSWPRQLLASGVGVGKRGQGGIWVLAFGGVSLPPWDVPWKGVPVGLACWGSWLQALPALVLMDSLGRWEPAGHP